MNMPTILHINNNFEVINSARNALQHAGYKVVEAYTGYSGLEAIKDVRPDAVLIEMDVTDMDGLQFIQALRANADTAVIPVLALTPRAQSINRLMAMQTVGIDDMLTKPFTPQELVEGVRKAIQGR